MYVVSIGGSDSSSGAGVQADIRACSALGVYCMSVITAVTAQNPSSIIKIKQIDADVVRAQLSALLSGAHGYIVKISMLYSKSIIDVVADTLKNANSCVGVVVDPVLRAGSGRYLIKRDARSYYIEKVVPLATIITPNLMEAEWLSSMRIRSYDDVCRAAEKISSLGAESVVIKGGHMKLKREGGRLRRKMMMRRKKRRKRKNGGDEDDEYDNDYDAVDGDGDDDEYVTDLLYHHGRFYRFTNRRIEGSRLHGAGTIFSAAIAAELAKGNDLVSAVRIASTFTHIAIINSSIEGSTRIPLIGNESIGNYDSDEVITTLRRAIDILQFTNGIALLIPESQSNLVFAKAGAESRDDVAGITGRIVRYEHGYDNRECKKYARAAGPIRYGASKHVADAVVTAMRYNASIRSAMNIRYDDAILDICKGLGFSIASYDRSKEPEHIKKMEGMSVKWGIEQAVISSASRVPDVVYHTGDWGKEPMMIVFGHDPMDVVNKVISILIRYKGSVKE
ncbi:Pyridoxine kinase [archaeon HR04]|nr:Pyridoxine kinase [archaeon HR04]